jgi:hypothetical protein
MQNSRWNLQGILKRTLLAKPQYIECPHQVTGRSIPAIRADIGSSALVPPPTNGTRLRAKGFTDDNCASGLVVQLLDDFAITEKAP